MAPALSFISPLPPPPAAHNAFSPSKAHKLSQALCFPKPFIRPPFPSVQTKSSFSARAADTVEDGRQSDNVSMSIDVLKRFIDLNSGNWTGSFHQFDCNGDLLHKISTKLAGSSLYVKQPPISTSDPEEWFEYKKLKKPSCSPWTNISRYQTAGMLETVIRQGVLGEDDTGEESPRNLKLPS